jgi:hypothetical protein
MNITQQEIVDYLMSIIEHGSDQDLLELYNAYTDSGLTIDQVAWEE